MRVRRRYACGLMALLAVLAAGFAWPEHPVIPVQGASRTDWNAKSFWFEPWGQSGVHKGIDIFARQGQPVVSAVPGVVVYQGQFGIGGRVVAVLGPKWRIHYYAHLDEAAPASWLVSAGQPVGAVGTSGNAAGKPPHLHYAVVSLVPVPWRISTDTQGWKKMFFLDPGQLLAGRP
ncbi:M23 family metallopeptidase [Ideonella sp. DXS29W]|uniref:M23 family metallopeptidase n=1 Tax=Ideonella lacteola TaxID=2984193 RepID=A0ABU9BYE0_9BURK